MSCKIPPCTVQHVDVLVEEEQVIVPVSVGETVRFKFRKPGERDVSDVDGVYIGVLPTNAKYQVAYNGEVNALMIKLSKMPAVFVEEMGTVFYLPPAVINQKPRLEVVPGDSPGGDIEA